MKGPGGRTSLKTYPSGRHELIQLDKVDDLPSRGIVVDDPAVSIPDSNGERNR